MSRGNVTQTSKRIERGGLASMIGGVLWALTPLREPMLGGEFREHPVFRPYKFALLVIAVLLTVGLLAVHIQCKGRYGRLGIVGIVIVLVEYALLADGSLPAVMLSGFRDLIMVGQDLGCLSALVAGVGAILLGIALWRVQGVSRLAALLFMIALPLGLVGVMLISAAGWEDIAGLPLTVLYGPPGSYSGSSSGRNPVQEPGNLPA